MNDFDQRLLEFHIANLEYWLGAPIGQVSQKDWHCAYDFQFEGPHLVERVVKVGKCFLYSNIVDKAAVLKKSIKYRCICEGHHLFARICP
ncbi:unnamed protein product [Gongylonema pulchrum]|uniref:SWIM-type domain-containing protein n=1 Tax=Gongylonema pulchrum TaxID=637853 RepID=A0A183ENW0_9BILA|nr:unnamed protein product [Gongylonema pulchrum]